MKRGSVVTCGWPGLLLGPPRSRAIFTSAGPPRNTPTLAPSAWHLHVSLRILTRVRVIASILVAQSHYLLHSVRTLTHSQRSVFPRLRIFLDIDLIFPSYSLIYLFSFIFLLFNSHSHTPLCRCRGIWWGNTRRFNEFSNACISPSIYSNPEITKSFSDIRLINRRFIPAPNKPNL